MANHTRFAAFDGFAQERNFDFSKHSSIGIGSQAEICFQPRSLAELCALLALLERRDERYLVLGNLTNVLPPDEPFHTPVIRLQALNEVCALDGGAFAYAGAQASKLLRFCREKGLTGAEFLQGIPCTVGGAAFMNAGAGGRYFESIVESLLVYRKGELTYLSKADCRYGDKHSLFMDEDCVIVGARLCLERSTPDAVERTEKRYQARRAHLPKGKSMGCVFRNPSGAFAGELIEKSGLKGFRVGGAKVSEEHANFILNDGGATAQDVKTLVRIAKNAVSAQYGVMLQEEIRYITENT